MPASSPRDEVTENTETAPLEGELSLDATLAYELPEGAGGAVFFRWDTSFPPPVRVGGRVWIEAAAPPEAHILLIASDSSATRFEVIARLAPVGEAPHPAGEGAGTLVRSVWPEGWLIDEARAALRTLTLVATRSPPSALDLGADVTCDGPASDDDARCRFLTRLDALAPPRVQGLEQPWRVSLSLSGARVVDASRKRHVGRGSVAVEFFFAARTP